MTEQATAQLPRPQLDTNDPWLGRVIVDRYRVLSRLGEGGMGVVYVAEQLSLQKKVALKVIHPQWAANQELLLRFKREALATAQLDHPHIASATDFGALDDGSAFMVMPWVRGQSLQRLMDTQGQLDLRRAARLCAQIADALSVAHSLGIVHRDLKPDNVLVEARGDGSESVKVLDFGIASLSAGATQLPSDVAQPLTRAGSVLGTPGYMAPEQASGAEIDARTDLYALGVILWEACAGRSLFPGDDISQIFSAQFRGPAPALDLGSSAAARELTDLVQRLLELDKTKRPQSAAVVRDTLRAVAEGSPQAGMAQAATVAASTSEVLERALARVSVVTTYVGGLERVKRAPKQARWAAALALSVVVALLVMTWGGDAEDSSTHVGSAETSEQDAKPSASKAASAAKEGALDAAQKVLFSTHARDSQRRAAARTIVEHEGEAPEHVLLSARIELTSRCSEKKELLTRIREGDHEGALPYLERLDATPKRGCGIVRLNDCLGCLRRELSDTLDELR